MMLGASIVSRLPPPSYSFNHDTSWGDGEELGHKGGKLDERTDGQRGERRQMNGWMFFVLYSSVDKMASIILRLLPMAFVI